MRLYIKNMVCPRCIMAVEHILNTKEIPFSYVRLGEVELTKELSDEQVQDFGEALLNIGFELLDDQRKQQIEKVKTLLIQKVQQGDIEEHFSISKFLAAQMLKDYSYLSKLFTQVEGITIEQFFIHQKIEKAKEWLAYKEHSLSEIAIQLGYSSVQHLSAQFKKVTGMTPGAFKKLGLSERKTIDKVTT